MAQADPIVFLQEADRRRAEIAAEIAALGFALPGSLVERRGRCGKPYCRCHTDPTKLHGPYLSWTRKVNNKTVTRAVSAEEADRYREWMSSSAACASSSQSSKPSPSGRSRGIPASGGHEPAYLRAL
jgi:hypothetical protein